MRDWKDTLNLPRTDFPMKANLPATEPATIARWDAMDLYGSCATRGRGAPKFVLHDGPPYANGDNPHRPRAQQDPQGLRRQVADDGRLRRAVRAGLGLPRPADRAERREANSAPAAKDRSPAEFRRACREFAEQFVDSQRDDFKRLGILGDWDDPYLTMTPALSGGDRPRARQVRRARPRLQGQEAGALVPARSHGARRSRSRVRDRTRRRRSTSSSRSRRTTTARSASRVPALAGRDVSVLIWTTTPWTIPANLAVAFHPDFDYGAYEFERPRGASSPRRLAEACATATGRRARREARVVQRARARRRHVPPSALRPRFARRARRLRHARSGHGRGAHRAGPRRRRLRDRRAVRPRHLRADRHATAASMPDVGVVGGLKVFEANPVVEAGARRARPAVVPHRRSSTRIRTAGAAISR